MRDDDIIDYREEKEPEGKGIAALIYALSLFAPILAPLLIWLIARPDSDFIDFHGKQYFNFFISYTIYSAVAGILVIVLIGLVILPILGLLAFVFTIVAAVKAYQGAYYVIPLTIPFFRANS
ncbi:DUF4870 domain-containing protein [Shouchella sp. JSM 1781072]|uniref:DUF4870 domain-containing protein n=1 Tax=Bacillaceae TaxID=186817 RepID=UPI000C077F8F|nr:MULTISPECIES: DUF4870 domain-containing protein [Bacillaceae]UTR05568.1 DUF4870 domain-containing protein [Alkalihalobacillus sp. LMS6]